MPRRQHGGKLRGGIDAIGLGRKAGAERALSAPTRVAGQFLESGRQKFLCGGHSGRLRDNLAQRPNRLTRPPPLQQCGGRVQTLPIVRGAVHKLERRFEAPFAKRSRVIITRVIRSRSSDDRRGFQTSQISTARGLSLSFHASCSMVSSKMKASPSRHRRDYFRRTETRSSQERSEGGGAPGGCWRPRYAEECGYAVGGSRTSLPANRSWYGAGQLD